MWLITVISWFNRRGQFIFHVGPGTFGQLFSLNKWNHHLQTAFCIYLHYLCVILTFISSVTNMQKKKKKQERGKNLFTALCIYIYIYYTHTLCRMNNNCNMLSTEVKYHFNSFAGAVSKLTLLQAKCRNGCYVTHHASLLFLSCQQMQHLKCTWNGSCMCWRIKGVIWCDFKFYFLFGVLQAVRA